MSINKNQTSSFIENNQIPKIPLVSAEINKQNTSQIRLSSTKDLPPLPSYRNQNGDGQSVNNDEVIAKLKLKLNRGNSDDISQQSPLLRGFNNDQQNSRNNLIYDNDFNQNQKGDQPKNLSNPQQLMRARKKESNFLYNYIQKQQLSQQSVTQESTNITKQKNLSHITQKKPGPTYCELCQLQQIRQLFTSSSRNENQERPKHVLQDKMIMNNAKKFMIKQEYYDLKAVNSILFNQQARIVSVFKDYLIFDDVCEFLTSTYTVDQSKVLFAQYAKKEKERVLKFKTISNSPNYCILEQKQMLIKNQKMKQKAFQDKIKLQKLLQQEQIQRQLDAAALKFNIGTQHMKKDSKNLQFQKLIQSSLVHEYNFTKQNISTSFQQVESQRNNKQNYENMNFIEKSLSISKCSIGYELNLTMNKDHVRNSLNKNDMSIFAKWFKMNDSTINLGQYSQNQFGLMTERTNTNRAEEQRMQIVSQLTQRSKQSHRKTDQSLRVSDNDNPFSIAKSSQEIKPAGSFLKQMNTISANNIAIDNNELHTSRNIQENLEGQTHKVRLMPDIPRPSQTPQLRSSNKLQKSQVQIQNQQELQKHATEQINLQKNNSLNQLKPINQKQQTQLIKTKIPNLSPTTDKQAVENYLDQDLEGIIETEKSQIDLDEHLLSQKSIENIRKYRIKQELQTNHRRVETEVDSIMKSYDSNDYQNFFNDPLKRKSDAHEIRMYQENNAEYFQSLKVQQNEMQDNNNIQRAVSNLSTTNKPPRDHKHTQSVAQGSQYFPSLANSTKIQHVQSRSRNTLLVGTQSEEEKKIFSSHQSIGSVKNTIGLDRTQNLMKINLRPSLDEQGNVIGNKNKKFIQKILFKNKRDSADGNFTPIQLADPKSTPNQIKYLRPSMQAQNFSNTSQFTQSNKRDYKNPQLTNSNPRFIISNSPVGQDNRKVQLTFMNNLSQTPNKSIQDKPYFSSMQSSVNNYNQTISQSRIIDHHRVSSQQSFSSNLQPNNQGNQNLQVSSNFQSIPKIKIVKKPKIIFNSNQGPDFSRNSMISQSSNGNQQQPSFTQAPSFISQVNIQGSPTPQNIKISQPKRMNRNEFISLKTRAHSYGGPVSNIITQDQNQLQMVNTKNAKDSQQNYKLQQLQKQPQQELLKPSSNSRNGSAQMPDTLFESNDGGIMIQDQREVTQLQKQNRQMIIKKTMKPSQIKLKVNQYKYVVRPQSNLDQYH
eukprot:403341110